MLERIAAYLFPQKCVLCRKILSDQETDLCHDCRLDAPEFTRAKKNISFVAGWTALWYYEGKVRNSLLRYKFYNARSYGTIYGRLLAMKLMRRPLAQFDILTWVPVSKMRLWKRGYDQVLLIAQSVAAELGVPLVPLLKKVRNTPAQSGINDASRRKANILGAYRVLEPEKIIGKRILLLDDIITTGATSSECARTLLTAGAKEVYCAAIAAAIHDKKDR